ncbi:MAG: DUF2851 family protein, partial [Chloroflexota bacterium]|nr:DUF2851 family protein [Chloroflexota bacterium]
MRSIKDDAPACAQPRETRVPDTARPRWPHRRRSTLGNTAFGMPPEESVAEWWRSGALGRVVALDGREAQMLYPGRPAPGSGPDFRDAVLITPDGELVRGDVEVHVRQSDWRGHGHHTDSRYKDVVLHLFLSGQRGQGAAASGAREVRIDHLPSKDAREPPVSCVPGRSPAAAPLQRLLALPRPGLEQALDEAGDRRFLRKASAMMASIRDGDSREVLYASLLEALGYSRNRGPMLRLARGLPLAKIGSLAGDAPDLLSLEALLLGSAGLLPHQRRALLLTPEGETRAAELSARWSMSELRPVLGPADWDRTGIRPQNSPIRRLAAAGFILARHWQEGLQQALLGLCGVSSPTGIRRAFQVEGDGFWVSHLDFHRPSSGAPALVGAGRAGEILANVLLPYLYA